MIRQVPRAIAASRQKAVALPAPLLHVAATTQVKRQGVSEASIDPVQFRQVLGAYPTGVCAITATGADSAPVGMVVGTFTSVSLDPPLVGFLPDKASATWPLIEASGHFCVNVLASDQLDICRQISGRAVNKFDGIDLALSAHGHPVIANALARIDCAIHDVVDAGDHWFVLGRVLSLEATRDDNPMLFWRGRYGGFAG
jgi:3-hydroxy-9,10-secoandrosta-1,3,5(10)-triene-9,17-dione monooxygenase reductase component